MKKETELSTQDKWNSSEKAIAGMDCSQVSAFLTGMVSSHRAMLAAGNTEGDLGAANIAIAMLQKTVDICSDPKAPQAAKDKLAIHLMAVGQALVISTSNADIKPEEVANLTSTALRVTTKVIQQEKEKFAGLHLEFGVRIKPYEEGANGTHPQIEIGTVTTPISDMVKLTKEPEIYTGKEEKKIVVRA